MNDMTIKTPPPQNLPAVDIVVVGAGIAGLWVANVLKRRGYSVVVFDRDCIGGTQTLASQGMIHGGQKYVLTGSLGAQAEPLAAMPARWQACFDGCGDVDLTGVALASDDQVMWPAGGLVAAGAVLAAAKIVNAATEKLAREDFPAPLRERPKFKGPVYRLPEKVMNAKSLVAALARPLQGCIYRGALSGLLPDGQVAFTQQGHETGFQAQLVVCAAGTGNEDALRLLRVERAATQRRPLRQIMVRPMPYPLNGHGITAAPKPRLTVTAARIDDSVMGTANDYVWYVGGNVAEQAAGMDDDAAIAFAQSELAEVFPHIDWTVKEWAVWHGDRAEPANPDGQLPPGPYVHQRGRALVAWPTKLTFAPLLADKVAGVVDHYKIRPVHAQPDLGGWPLAAMGAPPWETATWRTATGDKK